MFKAIAKYRSFNVSCGRSEEFTDPRKNTENPTELRVFFSGYGLFSLAPGLHPGKLKEVAGAKSHEVSLARLVCQGYNRTNLGN